MKVTINVTKECIERGLPFNLYCCPVALAAQGAGLNHVSVVPNSLRFKDPSGPGYKSVLLPSRVEDKIRRFDAGLTIRPFSFEIEIEIPEAGSGR